MIHADGQVDYLPQTVPMNESASGGPITWRGFRVADILLHEQTPGEYTLFVSHHYFAGDCVEFRISSVSLSLNQQGAAISGDWKTEFAANPCIKNAIFGVWKGEIVHIGGGIQVGGRMLMDGAEHLLVAIGDHGWYEWHDRQEAGDTAKPLDVDPDSHLGKLVRIELTSGEAEVVASGLRNPQGLVRDSEGNLWETEHGPQGGDELNLLKPGLDYGWPYVTLGIQYGNKIWPYNKVQGGHDGFEEPVFAWIPSIAISNLIVSDSQQFPLWQNDLLIASLAARSLFRVRIRKERVTYFEKIVIGERIRDLTEMPDGRIALLTDSAKILFVQRAPIYCQDDNDAESIYLYESDDFCTDVSRIIRDAEDPVIRSLDDTAIANPIIRSLFNVYIYEDWLIYVKSHCSENDFSHLFFLHIAPAHAKDLAMDHRQLDVNTHDFYSYQEDSGTAMNEDGCIVARALPGYEIERIYTGQALRVESATGEVSWKGPIWSGSYTFRDPGAAATPDGGNAPRTQRGSRQDESTLSSKEIESIIAEAEDPIIRLLHDAQFGRAVMGSLYNVYVHDDRLIYVNGSCSMDDLSHRFFLHITPVDANDLVEEHMQHGFNVYDFYASEENIGSAVHENVCMVAVPLPDFEIQHIYTGQVIREESPSGEVSWRGPIWEGSYTFSYPYAASTPKTKDSRLTRRPKRMTRPPARRSLPHIAQVATT